VTHALNDDLVSHNPIEDEIGIGKHNDPSKASFANPRPECGWDAMSSMMA
jgi:hypothetical protein